MGKRQLSGIDRAIQRAAKKGCNGLTQLFMRGWTEALGRDNVALTNWTEDLRRVICICPDQANGIQVVLHDLDELDPDLWSPEEETREMNSTPLRLSGMRKWLALLENKDQLVMDQGRLVITVPLPHDQTPAGQRLLYLHDGHHPLLVLWKRDLPLLLDVRVIQGFRFVFNEPYTPAPIRKFFGISGWPTVLDWHLDFRRFQPLYENLQRCPQDHRRWAMHGDHCRIWVPPIGSGTHGDKECPLWSIHIPSTEHPRLKVGYYVQRDTPDSAPRLIRFGPLQTVLKEDLAPAVIMKRVLIDHRICSDRLPPGFRGFTDYDNIVAELMQYPPPDPPRS